MLGAWLILLGAFAVAADGPDPADLVRKLGSEHFRERVEAARALETLGPRALPALKAAKDSADPRVRARAAALLEAAGRQAEVAGLTEPTLVRLDFHDRPLSEVLDELNRRHGFDFEPHIGPLPQRGMVIGGDPTKAQLDALLKRRITLESDRPLSFWQAIDRLCEASGTRHDLHLETPFGLSVGRFLLYSGLGGSAVASDSGAFRAVVTRLHSTHGRDFVKARGGAVERPLTVGLTLIPEPGRVVRPLGPVRLDEAVDDLGNSLLPDEKPEGRGSPVVNQSPTLNGPSGFEVVLNLQRADPSARTLRRLRGSVPVTVVAYDRDPVVIPLEGADGKTVRTKEVTVSVLEVEKDADGPKTVEVGVVSNAPGTRGFSNVNPGWPPDFVTFRPDSIIQRVELFDARGRKLPLTWTQGHGSDFNTIRSRVRLTPAGNTVRGVGGRSGPRPVPAELRYHDFAQVSTEIRFEFRDVPLP